MAVNAIGDATAVRGGIRKGLSLWAGSVTTVAATSQTITHPFKTVDSVMCTVNTPVGTPVSTGTAFVSWSVSGRTVTIASFDDTGAAVNFDKTVTVWILGKL